MLAGSAARAGAASLTIATAAAAAMPDEAGSRAECAEHRAHRGRPRPGRRARQPAAATGRDMTVEQRDGAGLLRVDGFAVALSDGRTATERSVALGEPVVLFDLALDYAACSRVLLAAAAQASDAAPGQSDRFVPAAGQEGLGAGRRAWPGRDANRCHAGERSCRRRPTGHRVGRRCGRRDAEGRELSHRPDGLGTPDRLWPHQPRCCGISRRPTARIAIEPRCGCSAPFMLHRHSERPMAELVRAGKQGQSRHCHDRPSGATQCAQPAGEARDRRASERPRSRMPTWLPSS